MRYTVGIELFRNDWVRKKKTFNFYQLIWIYDINRYQTLVETFETKNISKSSVQEKFESLINWWLEK